MIKSYSLRKKLTNAAVYGLLTVLALIWITPIVYLFILSLRKEAGAYTTYLLPKEYTLDNYKLLFTDTSLFN